MMNNQDMQFADPEWQPPQRGDVKFDLRESETFVPQPINRSASSLRVQKEGDEAAPGTHEHATSEPYAGLAPQQLRPDIPLIQESAQPYGHYWPPVRQKRRSSRAAWIIIVVVVIVFVSGMTSALFGIGSSFNHVMPAMGQPMPLQKGPPVVYKVQDHPTIIINNGGGEVNVISGDKNANQVLIQTSLPRFRDNSGNNDGITQDTAKNTITVDGNGSSNGNGPFRGNGDITVTVPADANLQIQDQFGQISVQGMSGEMNLQNNMGAIHVENSTLTGNSSLTSNGGEITFSGTLSPHGNYNFSSNSGAITLNVPGNSSFHLDAKTDSGAFTSSFGALPTGTTQGPGAEVHGDVGTSASNTPVKVKTGSGDITINQLN